MRELKVIRLRNKYLLNGSDGEPIKCGDYTDFVQAAVKAVLPDKAITVREQDMLVDQLCGEEPILFATAIASIPELKGFSLEEATTVFCEITGEPIRGKERFYELAAKENRLATEEFEAKYGPDADEDDVVDW